MKALVLEGQRIVGELIAGFLAEVAGLDVLGICCTTAEACVVIQAQPPQLLVLDAALANDNFRDATDLLHALNPRAELLFHTGLAIDFLPPSDLVNITIGVLNQRDGLDELLTLLQRWRHDLSEPLQASLLGCAAPLRAIERLTPRERELLLEIGCGQLNKQIAASLGLSTATVETYRKRVATKLGMSGAELVRLAVIYRALRWSHHIGHPQPPIPEP